MSRTLRALTVASCTAIVVAGAVTSAGATGAPAFRIHPAYGQVGTKLTLTGSSLNSNDAVTVGGLSAPVKSEGAHKLVVTVPAGAHTGAVVAIDGSTKLTGPTYTVQQATSSTASVSTSQLTFTHPLVVTGVLKTRSGGTAVAGQSAYLQHRVAGSTTWRHAFGTKPRRTGPKGAVSWRLDPASSGSFRVYFAGGPLVHGRDDRGAHRARPPAAPRQPCPHRARAVGLDNQRHDPAAGHRPRSTCSVSSTVAGTARARRRSRTDASPSPSRRRLSARCATGSTAGSTARTPPRSAGRCGCRRQP